MVQRPPRFDELLARWAGGPAVRGPRLDEKDSSGCAISGVLREDGELIGPEMIVRSINTMQERSNGLGGGFAAYGIYPELGQLYALHVMGETGASMEQTGQYIREVFSVAHEEPIPTRAVRSIVSRPMLQRYFVLPKDEVRARHYELGDDDLVVAAVMHINAHVPGAHVLSSGKNMGVFKGVGFPGEIADFYRLEDYRAYLWIAHARFPTNTTGWWGGAHPFGLLDWAVVHNGEISSYGINRRYLANFGYHCALQTDTEVIAYLFDLLVRKHGLGVELACKAMAPPFWSQIGRLEPQEQELLRTLRTVYGGALLNGPFSVVVGFGGGMLGFNDRTKLRPMTAARCGSTFWIASEESAIRAVCASPERIWQAKAGVPVMGQVRLRDVEEVASRA